MEFSVTAILLILLLALAFLVSLADDRQRTVSPIYIQHANAVRHASSRGEEEEDEEEARLARNRQTPALPAGVTQAMLRR